MTPSASTTVTPRSGLSVRRTTSVAPAAIEGAIATSKYVGQGCVVGDRRKYLTCLVTLDPDNIVEFAAEKGIAFEGPADLLQEPEIIALIQSVIEEKNSDFASFETIKKFRIVDEFTIENGLLTPTLKVKRNIAMERYAEVIEEMYSD